MLYIYTCIYIIELLECLACPPYYLAQCKLHPLQARKIIALQEGVINGHSQRNLYNFDERA